MTLFYLLASISVLNNLNNATLHLVQLVHKTRCQLRDSVSNPLCPQSQQPGLDLSMNAEGARAGVLTGALCAKQLLIGVLGSATGNVLHPLARSVSTGLSECKHMSSEFLNDADRLHMV